MSGLLQKCRALTIATFVLFCLPMVGWSQTTIREAAKAAKVTADLYQVMLNNGPVASAVVDGFVVETNQVFAGNRVAIEAVANNEDGEGLLSQLRALGLTDGVAHKRMIFGYLPIDKLDELKNVPSLSFARPYYKPETNTGAVTSQGDPALKADVARTTYSVTGAGVKVGVLSDSYNNLGGAPAGIASDDLPAGGVQVLLDLASGGADEGRAMAEIIHDVAPGSAIAFNTAFTGQAGFAQGILNLAAAGCQVIVDDIIYLAEPFFQDGIIAQAADQVVNNGSSYFSAAGNQARSSYQAPYKNGGTYSNPAFFGPGDFPTHDFGSGAVDNLQRIVIPSGGRLRLVLQWDNPFQSVSGGMGATTDLDILILNSSTGAVLAYGANSNVGADPVEVTGTVSNTTSAPLNVDVVIVKYEGPDPGLIKWVNFGSSNIAVEYDTKSGASYGHSNAARAISVGAAPWYNTPVYNGAATATIEPFSSAGGTPTLFTTTGTRINGITGVVRQKPEITSVDGGNNTFFGSDTSRDPDAFPNFFGTSAAAPHAAAVAALMKQKVPAITPATILSTLESTALDMDDPATGGFDSGFDFGTGFGFIQADRALQAISTVPNTPPTVANTIAPQSATVGQAFTFTIPANTFTDAETPGSLTLSVSGLPAGLMFAGGVISGTPSVSGVSTITVTATDPGMLSVSTTFTLTVSPAGVVMPPVTGPFSITGVTTVSCATVTAGQRMLVFTPRYAGLTGQPISFSVVNELLPTMAPGPYTLRVYTDNPVITLKATQQGTAGEASFTYNWLAACNGGGMPPGNQAPVVANTIAPQSATVGVGFSFTIPSNTFSDPNGDALTLSVSGLPAGLMFAGGVISGTPSVSGVSTITVTATDPGMLSVSTTFTLTVSPAGVVMPPVTGPFSITGVTTVSCATVTAGQRMLVFTPRYAGLTGQPISFSVVNELLPTMAPGPYTLRVYTDNPVITLKATQQGTAGEASFTYNWLAACNSGSARLAAAGGEKTIPLSVTLYPNPVAEEFAISIQGAQGKSVRIVLTDVNGRSLTNTSVDVTTSDHRELLRPGLQRAGLYLLRVSTDQQVVTLKVIKQ